MVDEMDQAWNCAPGLGLPLKPRAVPPHAALESPAAPHSLGLAAYSGTTIRGRSAYRPLFFHELAGVARVLLWP